MKLKKLNQLTYIYRILTLGFILPWLIGCNSVSQNPIPALPGSPLPAPSDILAQIYFGDSLVIPITKLGNFNQGLTLTAQQPANGYLVYRATRLEYVYFNQNPQESTDSIKFKVCDATGNCSNINYLITLAPSCVTAINADLIYVNNERSFFEIDLLANDILCNNQVKVKVREPNVLANPLLFRVINNKLQVTLPFVSGKVDTIGYRVVLAADTNVEIGRSVLTLVQPQCDTWFMPRNDSLPISAGSVQDVQISTLIQNDRQCAYFIKASTFSLLNTTDSNSGTLLTQIGNSIRVKAGLPGTRARFFYSVCKDSIRSYCKTAEFIVINR